MPVSPYKVRPVAPLMAVLQAGGETVLTEEGNEIPLAELPSGYRVWGSWDRVNELWGDGHGEALCWRGRPVRWRHTPLSAASAGGWVNRHTDVRVLRLSFPEEDELTLDGFCSWRDWLRRKGATPGGSLGSTAFSLLRASLRQPLWLSVNWKACGSPVPYIMGGRQELLQQGRFEPARHYDLPAAYAQQMGGMRYGGHWTEVGKNYPYAMVARRGILCFVRARVRIPADLPLGPLPRRPRRAPNMVDAIGPSPFNYPRGVLQGVWTWEELDAAESAGCKVRPLQIWIHHCKMNALPFWPWWESVLEGRGLPGFAGALGKATGNALWGQFCITPGAARTIQRWSGTRARPLRHKRTAPLPGSSPYYAPDLAETLTGRVRADLFRCMLAAGRPLLCAHTDGIWTEGEVDSVPEEWRAKEKVARLDVLTPQLMRFYRIPPPRGLAEYIVAGAPDTLAPAIFDFAWDRYASEGRLPQ